MRVVADVVPVVHFLGEGFAREHRVSQRVVAILEIVAVTRRTGGPVQPCASIVFEGLVIADFAGHRGEVVNPHHLTDRVEMVHEVLIGRPASRRPRHNLLQQTITSGVAQAGLEPVGGKGPACADRLRRIRRPRRIQESPPGARSDGIDSQSAPRLGYSAKVTCRWLL